MQTQLLLKIQQVIIPHFNKYEWHIIRLLVKCIEEFSAPPPLHLIFLCIFVSPPIWASRVDARFFW